MLAVQSVLLQGPEPWANRAAQVYPEAEVLHSQGRTETTLLFSENSAFVTALVFERDY